MFEIQRSSGGSGATAASQAEMETATDTTKMVTPGRTQYHPGVAKAWINFNGSGTPAARASLNVSSITDGGVGIYTLNWTTAFSGTDYCVLGTGSGINGTNNHFWCLPNDPATNLLTGSCQVRTYGFTGSAVDMVYAFVAAYGDQ